ncbi:MAG: DUF2796 domain-containing protein [Litoreibacter sp.]
MKHALPLCLTLVAAPTFAEETRELGAHEHGVGELNIAFEGNTVAMEFHAPGADIVGFEYEASSAEDRAAIDAAVATLAKPLELFVLPAAAECSVTQASAELESEDAHDDHEHEEHAEAEKHDEHDHEKHAEAEGHDDHDHEKHAEAEGHDDHDHEEHASEEAGHTEFHAEYTLSCGNPSAVSEITFAYFDTFENALELEVQVVSASGAQAFEVERDEPKLDLSGMF